MYRRNFLAGLLALPFLGFLKPRAEAKEFTWDDIRPKGLPINQMPNWAPPGPWQVNSSPVFPADLLEKYAEADVKATREAQLKQDLTDLKAYISPVDLGRRVKELMFKYGLTAEEIGQKSQCYNLRWLSAITEYSKLTRQAAKLYRDRKTSLSHVRLLREVDRNHQFAFLEEAQTLSYYDFSHHIEHYFLLKNKEGIKAVFDPVRTEYGVKRKYHNKDGQSRTFFHRYSTNHIQQLTIGHPCNDVNS